ncbi:MAG: AraC family transcriptional regulator [Clostridia bacterium]|nr:AraC family transcriptional regulator [Clostridia bacterium]
MELFLQTTPPQSVAAHTHIHDSIELLYATAGSFTVIMDGTEYSFSAGDLILFCSNVLHHVTTGSDAKNSYYVIKIPPSLLLDLSADGQGASYAMRFSVGRRDLPFLWRADALENSPIASALRALIAEYTADGYAREIALKLRAADLLLAILRDGAEARESDGDASGNEITGRIYAALLYMRRHFAEDIDVRSLATRMGVSYSYFSRSFGHITGQSFKEYLNLTRVNHAERLLRTTKKTVTEIAAECGYNNVSYFIAVYRRMKGMTPREAAKNGYGADKQTE